MAAPKDEGAGFVPSNPKVEASLNQLALVVEISSSSEKSTTSEEAGEEATSSALLSPNGKRAALSVLDLSVLPASAENSRKKPRLSEECQTETSDLAASMSEEEEKGDAFDLPLDFLEPLEPEDIPLADFALALPHSSSRLSAHCTSGEIVEKISRQFWKAGDYDSFEVDRNYVAGGMDHVRVHPKFLHSNATSHKWALGAIAELLDNALDEAVNGAKWASIDMVQNPRDGSPMLMIEDDGGGMGPERMRQCMSLGYSAKSKIANTIGQYGNGFKTSTMRLGADAIVFSRCRARDGAVATQSVGMLSYTFLTATGQEDIIVPMIDYEVQPFGLRKLIRGNLDDWNRNMETILQWCPYVAEKELLDQLNRITRQGTVVIVYNLWEDEQGETELDFDANRHDIQLRGTNRDERNISMATRYPNCQHYFTYRYSLRSYVSILYLRLPVGFKIILRGEEVRHHNLVNDLMLTEELKYRPQTRTDQTPKDYGQMMAAVTIGFLKDAREHIDIQGFNVYHKNRLIKPFWRLWNIPGVQGRGIVGVLEANFVEPAHDKQDFERTIILARLEARLLEIQKRYWSKNCQEVGYANSNSKKIVKSASKVGSVSDDRTMENSSLVVREVQTPPTRLVEARASNSPSSEPQRQFHAGLSKMHDALIKPILDVPRQSIPLATRSPAQFQNTAQAHPCTVSMETGTAHEAELAMPMLIDRQEQLQTCPPSMPLLVTRSLRSPMPRIPATAYQTHAVIGQAHTAPKPNAGMSPRRQTSVDEGPIVFPGVSVPSRSQNTAQAHPCTGSMGTGTANEAGLAMPMSIDRQEQLQTGPSMPLLVTRSLRSPMPRIPATAYQNHAVIGQAHTAPKPNAGMSPRRQTSVDEGPVVFPGVSVTSRSQAHSLPTLPELSAIAVSRIEPEKSPKETQSLLDAAKAAVTESSISHPGQDKTQQNLPLQISPSLHPETRGSPLGVDATDFSQANLTSSIPKRTELHQNKPMMQTATFVDLDQRSSITTLRMEALEEIITRPDIAGHVAELNTILQTSPNEANASNSTPRMPEVDHCDILNEIESSAELKAKIEILKQKVQSLQRTLEQLTKERDSLKAELDDERKKKSFEDEELQKKLQALFLRARELEDENKN